MKNIKNYKMKEINFGANFKSAQLYSTNKPGSCCCGCSGVYEELTFNELLKLLQENNQLLRDGNFKVFDAKEMNDQNYKIEKGEGYYRWSTIIIKLGSFKDKERPWHNWRSRHIVLELEKDIEKCLY